MQFSDSKNVVKLIYTLRSYASGGALDSQSDSQQWLEKQLETPPSQPPSSNPTTQVVPPVLKKRKLSDNMSMIEECVKGLRAELEEGRLERAALHDQLSKLQNENRLLKWSMSKAVGVLLDGNQAK